MEYIARHITPYLRNLAVLLLVEKGYSQYKISKLMGFSQPMINKILKSRKEDIVKKLTESDIPEEEAILVPQLIAEAIERNPLEALRLLSTYELSVLSRGIICRAYKKENPEVDEACRVIETLYVKSDIYIEETKKTFEKLREIEGIGGLIPEVGANIAIARPGAKNYLEVVAFPGRIVKTDEGVVAVGEPAYGASRHTAKVLLSVMKRRPGVRVCLVLKRDPKLLSLAESMNFKICSVEGYSSEKELLERIEKALEEGRGKCDIIDARGGIGFEPTIYVFGKTGLETAVLVGRLACKARE